VATVSIPPRFNGPPASANGGFACGTLAAAIDARAAEVTLRLPPPLATEMAVEDVGDGRWEMRSGEDLVAEARQLDGVEADPPWVVSIDDARTASAAYPWYEGHIYPTCFVCGPGRSPDDGLDVFTGPVEGRGIHAAAWTPSLEWADDDGSVRDEIVWAALDCPSSLPVMTAGGRTTPAALGRLSASLERPVRAGEPHALIAWALGEDGRKLHSASAVVDAAGKVLARARAVWVTLPAPIGADER
jgi:hypothetical protein